MGPIADPFHCSEELQPVWLAKAGSQGGEEEVAENLRSNIAPNPQPTNHKSSEPDSNCPSAVILLFHQCHTLTASQIVPKSMCLDLPVDFAQSKARAGRNGDRA